MADTLRNRTTLQTLFADNENGDISAQDLRDLVASVPLLLSADATTDNAVVRMHSTDGLTVQSSTVIIDDSGNTSVNSIVLASLEADPETPADGTIWHRSDVDEIRIRVGSTTLKLVASPTT